MRFRWRALVTVFIAFLVFGMILANNAEHNKEENNSAHHSVENGDNHSKHSESFLFILITKSAPQSKIDRDLLRTQSWLSYSWKDENLREISYRHFFLVGLTMDPESSRSKMEEENEIHGDILISQTFDTYRRLTYKLMWGLQHLIENYKFAFVVVLAEDSLVNVSGLNRYLTGLIKKGEDKNFFGGPDCKIRKIHRIGKASITKNQWPYENLPVLCVGVGLVFSKDTVEKLLRTWNNDHQPTSGLDDVQIAWYFFMLDTPIRKIENITIGCQKMNPDSFIVTQIKPLTKGVELMKNFMDHGVYCFENVKQHPIHSERH